MGPRVSCIIMERLAEISALTWCTAAVPRPFVCRIAVTAKIVSQLSARLTRKTPDRLPGPVVILADFACCEYLHASRSFGPAHLSGLDFWPAEVLVLTARTAAALRQLAERYVYFLERTEEDWGDICHTAASGRAVFGERLAVVPEAARARNASPSPARSCRRAFGAAAWSVAGRDRPAEREASAGLRVAQRRRQPNR